MFLFAVFLCVLRSRASLLIFFLHSLNHVLVSRRRLALVLGGTVDLVAVAVEVEGLVVPEGVLQGPGDLHALDAEVHGDGDGLVLENAVAELVGLGGEGVLEALPVLRGDLVVDAGGTGDLDVVLPGC